MKKRTGIRLGRAVQIAAIVLLHILAIQASVFPSHAFAATVNLALSPEYTFPTSRACARAIVANPEDNDVGLAYTLKIAHEEIVSVSGGCPCHGEAQSSGSDGEDIILWSSDVLRPGEEVISIEMDKLPDHWPLPYGAYQARMHVEQFSIADNARLPEALEVDVLVTVMLDEQEVSADKDGNLYGLRIYNETERPAIYQLIISAQELRVAAGLTQYAGEGIMQEEYIMVPLCSPMVVYAFSGLADMPRLCALPDGRNLPAGTYQAWIARYAEGDEPIICAAVELAVGDYRAQPPADMDDADVFQLAQAYVNAAYLLRLSAER